MSTRLEHLRSMVQEDPDDPFGRYALAMELKGLGEAELALDAMGEVVRRTPDYVPVYYQMARLLIQAGRSEEAGGTISAGLAQARAAGDDHAAAELAELQEELG